jgi:hypothetical protein
MGDAVSPDASFRAVESHGPPRNDQFATSENAANMEITLPVTPAEDIESGLLFALTEAAKAGRFDVVAKLADELRARREATAGNVVPLVQTKKGLR